MRIKNYGRGINVWFLLIGAFCFGQYRASDYELIGNVKSMSSVTRIYNQPNSTAVSGFLDSEQFDSICLKFDQRKYLTLRENFLDYRGRLGIFDRTVYQYNPSQQIEKLENILIQNGEEPRKVAQRKIFYYLKNQLVRTDEFNSGRTSNQHWVVNSVYSGNRLSEKVFWMDDAIFSTTAYEFDSNHNPVSEKTVHNNGQQGLVKIYQNNSAGMPLKIISRSGNKETVESIEYGSVYPSKISETDDTENLVKLTLYDPNGRIFEIRKLNYLSNDTDIYNFEYQYDSNNNWTNCIIKKNQIPAFIISREIRYY